MSSTGGYGNVQMQPGTHSAQAPSYSEQHVAGGQHQQGQFPGNRPNPLRQFFAGIHGKVSNAIKSVKHAFRSIVLRKNRPRTHAHAQKQQGQGTGIGYNRRSNLFGMDFWNLDSPLGRIYRWVENAINIKPRNYVNIGIL